MNSNILNSYDIRGQYNQDFNKKDIIYLLENFFLEYNLRKVSLAFDTQANSFEIAEEILNYFPNHSIKIYYLGIISTPMSYFSHSKIDIDVSIMITSSHKDSSWVGLKIYLKDSLPLNEEHWKFFKKIINNRSDKSLDNEFLEITTSNIAEEYQKELANCVEFEKKPKILVVENDLLKVELENFVTFFDLDFIEAPGEGIIIEEYLEDYANSYDYIVSTDKDVDRISIYDEKGILLSSQKLTLLLAGYFLSHCNDLNISCDERLSYLVKQIGKDYPKASVSINPIGHSRVKKYMIENSIHFAAEQSGHFYYSSLDNHESIVFTMILLSNHLAKKNVPLSKLVEELSLPLSYESNFVGKYEKNMNLLKFFLELFPTAKKLDIGFSYKSESLFIVLRCSNIDKNNLQFIISSVDEKEFQKYNKIISNEIKQYGYKKL